MEERRGAAEESIGDASGWSDSSQHTGAFDPQFLSCMQQHRKRLNQVLLSVLYDSDQEEEEGTATPSKRSKQGVVWYRDEQGNLTRLPPTMSLWYNLYCSGEEVGVERQPNFHSKFRNRFRMPYLQYKELLELCISESMKPEGLFKRWQPGRTGGDGRRCTPIELLLLAALRYLGRGWTFDDLEESTAISRDVIRVFFHKFIEFGLTVLYKMWVTQPLNLQQAQAVSSEYRTAGFPGCIGSMDASHVQTERMSYRLRQAHLAFKMPFTARTYNIIVNHRRRILSSTKGHPARWNDKTLVNFDDLAVALNEGSTYLKDLPFELYERDEEGDVVRQKYRGAWLLVDNGYLNWGVTIPPLKEASTTHEWRFSKWLESMRKDVECTFGILKGRWRVLKAGIRLHDTDPADKIWLTCCALHNMLLEVDGLDAAWSSVWTGPAGDVDLAEVPDAVRRLINAPSDAELSSFDTGGAGFGSDRDVDLEPAPLVECVFEHAPDGAIIVHRLNMNEFRRRLIVHFSIAFQRRELAWPKARMKNTEAPVIEEEEDDET